MVKAIMFDMGGVLLDLDMQRCKAAFKERCGYFKIDEVLDPCHQRGPFMMMEHGLYSEKQFIGAVLQESRPGTTPGDVRDSLWSFITGIEPYKADVINALKAGYPLYMLSNNNPIVMRRCRSLFRKAGVPLNTTFRKMFISYRMKMLKPDDAIFEAAIRGTGLKPEEILFIDDSPTNVAAAQKAGMTTVLYTPGSDMGKAIADKLDTINYRTPEQS